jgi:hypothetical protein
MNTESHLPSLRWPHLMKQNETKMEQNETKMKQNETKMKQK